MLPEITTAARFVSKMMSEVPDETKTKFESKLIDKLVAHCEQHWFEDRPNVGSAYRCLRNELGKKDPLIVEAAIASGIALSKLPCDICVWVDPRDVCARIGSYGSIFPVPLEKANKHSVIESEQHASQFQQQPSHFTQPSASRPMVAARA